MRAPKLFDPREDDPDDFDRRAFGFLQERYGSHLIRVLNDVRQKAWFSRPMEDFAQKTADWTTLRRHLLLGFSVAEAVELAPQNLDIIWEGYARARVLPLCALDDCLDQDEPLSPSTMAVVPYLGAAILEGQEFFSQSSEALEFWRVMRASLLRAASAIHFELSVRFDTRYVDEPESLVRLYEAEDCPSRRSSSFETFVLGLSALRGLSVSSPAVPRAFESLRQTLDDVADIREDIVVGRLTYPALLTLSSADIGVRAKSSVRELWGGSYSCDEWWPDFRHCMRRARILERVEKETLEKISLVRSWIGHSLPGDTTPLLLLVEAKRAALYRLLNADLGEVSAPPLDLNLESEDLDA